MKCPKCKNKVKRSGTQAHLWACDTCHIYIDEEGNNTLDTAGGSYRKPTPRVSNTKN